MPTADRRPRRRKGLDQPVESIEELREQARQAKGDPKIWDAGLRRRLIRALVAQGHKPEIAEGIARAWERKPYYIPSRPPPGAAD